MGDVTSIIEQKRKDREIREAAEAAKEVVLAQRKFDQTPVGERVTGIMLSQQEQKASDFKAEPLLKYFATSDRMPKEILELCGAYGSLAQALADNLKPSAERTVTLRKLLESKDAAIRTLIDHLKGE